MHSKQAPTSQKVTVKKLRSVSRKTRQAVQINLDLYTEATFPDSYF